MARSSFFARMASAGSLLALIVMLCVPLPSFAQADRVETYRDANGWKLKVNGEDYFIKGVVWGYSPRGQNYTYALFNQPDDFIRKVLDYEFSLMRAANINTIRSFTTIPPRWVEYIYREHGIRTVINPLMGRYGYLVDGKWIPFTDYSDPRTREVLIEDMANYVRAYKDTPGVLMFAFGNESNYGLSWSSFEIENLPQGEQQTAKARYLYSLFAEVIAESRKVAPGHLFTIVNGDIQYIDLIAEYLGDMDVLGSNVYRGPSFTTLWEDVQDKLDMPVVFFEFGSDAFNALTLQEDQLSQALVLKSQWQEMYNKAYGQGEEGNSIGAFVFEWRDEWWKYLQIENLDVQDTNASWSNQAYLFDWAEGRNNMNEEWFGITALGTANADGVFTARPRMAYDVLAEVFKSDPYTASKGEINGMFAALELDVYELKGEVRALKAESAEEKRKLRLTGGDIRTEFVFRGFENEITERGEDAVEFSDGEMVFVDFAFNPSENLEGQFSLNVLGNVADKRPLEFDYGQRGLPLVVEVPTLIDGEFETRELVFNDRERVEIYDFSANYTGKHFDVEAFYHTPRFHWAYEGDFFGLIQEATDIPGIDVFNGKAPEGVEFAGKGVLDGLKIVAGPEIYWGANPKAVIKYEFDTGPVDWAVIHSEDFARLGQGANATQATQRQTRATTLYGAIDLPAGVKFEAGGIISAPERIDEQFDFVDPEGNIRSDTIRFKDTLGGKGKLSFPLLGTETYVSAHYAGLVSEGGNPVPTFGVMDPTRLPYNGLGNKREFELGSIIRFGQLMLYPRFMYRDNLIDANPFIPPSVNPDGTLSPGLSPRNRDDDPFAVLGNRAARSGEVVFTWDPTGATPFYDWDNEWREDARFAFNLGFNYTEFPTATDANLFFFEPGGSNASFGQGLPAEDVWTISSRMVFNPGRNSRYWFWFVRGFDQPTGDPTGGSRDYYRISWKAEVSRRHLVRGYFAKNDWGPEDFFRQFNFTYPEQVELDYSYVLGGTGLLGNLIDEIRATRVGVRTIFRTVDENSLPEEFMEGDNDWSWLSTVYFTWRF
jgi:beta-galactosidase